MSTKKKTIIGSDCGSVHFKRVLSVPGTIFIVGLQVMGR